MSFWVAGAVVGSGVIGAVGSEMAAGKQAGAQQQAAQTQMDMFNRISGFEAPFRQSGVEAQSALNQLLGLGPRQKGGVGGLPYGYLDQRFAPTQAQLNAYPGYQFALRTGGQAIRNQDTPGVGALSGPALKDLMNFNVGTANQFYGQYFNQFQEQQQNIFQRLAGIAGIGQAAAGQQAAAGTSLGTGVAQAQAAAGGSQAGGIVGATNALGGSAVPLAYYLSQQNKPPPANAGGVGGAEGTGYS